MASLTFKESIEMEFYAYWVFALDEFNGNEDQYDEWVTEEVLNEYYIDVIGIDKCNQIINDSLSEYLLMVRKISHYNEPCNYGNIEMVVNKYRQIIAKEYKENVLVWGKYMDLLNSMYR